MDYGGKEPSMDILAGEIVSTTTLYTYIHQQFYNNSITKLQSIKK